MLIRRVRSGFTIIRKNGGEKGAKSESGHISGWRGNENRRGNIGATEADGRNRRQAHSLAYHEDIFMPWNQ